MDVSHIEIVSDEMVEILRKKTPAQRLAMAHGMWTHARNVMSGVIRQRHPEWSEDRVNAEIVNRMHGPMEAGP